MKIMIIFYIINKKNNDLMNMIIKIIKMAYQILILF